MVVLHQAGFPGTLMRVPIRPVAFDADRLKQNPMVAAWLCVERQFGMITMADTTTSILPSLLRSPNAHPDGGTDLHIPPGLRAYIADVASWRFWNTRLLA